VLPRATTDWRGHASEAPWAYGPLALLRQEVEDAGLRLTVIEDNPPMDRLRLGLPGREDELEHVLELIQAMGRLGIGVWCYNWMAVVPCHDVDVEPGARRRGCDRVRSPRVGRRARRSGRTRRRGAALDESRVVPRAGCPGGRGGGRTPRPPPGRPAALPLRGIGRIVRSLHAFERVFELDPSPANGMTMCQGNVALMTDDPPAAIRRLGSEGRIHFVHFRDVRGTPERFVETFVDDGPTDMAACIRAYRESGVNAPLRTDHSPRLTGDAWRVAGYPTLARLHAIGYVQGLLAATG
jgi:mannonate dehydratase